MPGGGPAVLIAAAFLVLLPASEFAIAWVQRAATRLVGPRRLPRLDFSGGVPDSARTMVIVPTMLTSSAGVDALLEHVEVLALGNLDPCVHFAVLSDLADTGAPDTPEDAAILRRARTGVEALNLKYGAGHANRFFLFHRDRRWNVGERARMGWERKRGKIEEFNRLLRGATDTSFSTQVGALDLLPTVRDGITLDSDTRLPRDAARRLIGIIAHPLNQPWFDRRLGRVTAGYGILQPRVSVTMASAAGSLFARDVRRPHRRRPVHDRRLRCLSGPVRRGHLHRQGPVRRRRVRRGARGSRAGERAPVPRPVRGALRPDRTGERRRGRGRLSLQRPRARTPAASLGAR
jgi:cyclic beta-1,2-glucan synthetase